MLQTLKRGIIHLNEWEAHTNAGSERLSNAVKIFKRQHYTKLILGTGVARLVPVHKGWQSSQLKFSRERVKGNKKISFWRVKLTTKGTHDKKELHWDEFYFAHKERDGRWVEYTNSEEEDLLLACETADSNSWAAQRL